ncbi:MAG: HDOD domain-containing protein [Clostridiales Family XIII bacterium]|jgi:EAL and modified HD-GYP domain-containing signal transduction protein|nr:HDOD domain-containing protein [Clostridiales Family XIII bacterium]
MDILIIPTPLFDENVAVQAYYLRNRRGNELLEATGTASLDGAMLSPPLEVLNIVGLEALTMGKPIFVPVTRYMLLSRLEIQSNQPAGKLVFLVNAEEIDDAGKYVGNMERLVKLGYRFAMRKITDFEAVAGLLPFCSHVLYDVATFDLEEEAEIRRRVAEANASLSYVYANISSVERFKELSGRHGGMFEGTFYRMPVSKGKRHVAPLQANMISLMNTVRRGDFSFSDVSAVVGKDPALAVSLLKMVNSAHFAFREKIKSINQAVVMLGQKEVAKWITTAVARQLGAKKPGELTRVALVRAKFAEEMGIRLGMAEDAQSIFLMGLFSVLDAMLDMPLVDALGLVQVSDEIYDALVRRSGRLNYVYQFVLEYEAANWTVVSRMMIIKDIRAADVYEAYMGAMIWYNSLLKND